MRLDVTMLLRRARAGDRSALDELIPAVYSELRGLAERQLSHERAGHTLQPTALVSEAFIRLFGDGAPDVRDRRHFAGIAARVMRQVLVDYARVRAARKRALARSRRWPHGHPVPLLCIHLHRHGKEKHRSQSGKG